MEKGKGGNVLDDVLRESTVRGDSARLKILAQHGFASSAVEAVIALSTKKRRVHEDMQPATTSNDENLVRTEIPTSATTRSPIWKSLTFFPISTTFPIASWPGMSCGEIHQQRIDRNTGRMVMTYLLTGNLAMNSPSWMCASVPHTPQQETDHRIPRYVNRKVQ